MTAAHSTGTAVQGTSTISAMTTDVGRIAIEFTTRTLARKLRIEKFVAASHASMASSGVGVSPPDDVVPVARQCVLDWLGVTFAGASEPLAGMLADELAGDGDATLVGRSTRASAPMAALVNGATSHALDFDDTHLAIVGHPTVPVAPAVLALGERLDAPGAAVLRAPVG